MTAVAAPKSAPAPQSARSRKTPYLLLLPGMAWLFVFFVLPLGSLLMQSLQTRVPGGLAGEYEQTFRFANFIDVLSRPAFAAALGRSFLYALLATIAALLIAYPLAYAIALRAGRAKTIFLILVIAPFFVSFVLRTIAWRQILGAEGPVVSTLQSLNLVPDNFTIYPSSFAVVAGLTYNFLPFMTLPIYASLDRMDTRLIEAAQDLYSSNWTAFRKVTFPISTPGIELGKVPLRNAVQFAA